MQWRIFTYRARGEGSRDRVGVWRELRRVGAVSLQAATWAIPCGDRFDQGLAKAVRLAQRGGGLALVFDVTSAEEVLRELERLYTVDREAEWVEFCSECDKAVAEIRGEFDKEKFTLAELDEEEHNVDRLRRWYRELRAKDLFAAPAASRGEAQLKAVVELLDDFADRVYEERQS